MQQATISCQSRISLYIPKEVNSLVTWMKMTHHVAKFCWTRRTTTSESYQSFKENIRTKTQWPLERSMRTYLTVLTSETKDLWIKSFEESFYSILSLVPIAESSVFFKSFMSLSNFSFSQFFRWISTSNAAVGVAGRGMKGFNTLLSIQ